MKPYLIDSTVSANSMQVSFYGLISDFLYSLLHLNAKMRRKKKYRSSTYVGSDVVMNRNCQMSEVCSCVEFSWATSEPDVNM